MTTIQQLAGELDLFMERRTRANGDRFWCLREDAPAWMQTAIYKTHGDMLPDDFVYRMIAYLADEISDMDEHTDLVEAAYETAERFVADYNSELLAWLSSHSSRCSRVEDVLEEHGYCKQTGLFGPLQIAQHEEIQEIYTNLLYALADRRDELEAEE